MNATVKPIRFAVGDGVFLVHDIFCHVPEIGHIKLAAKSFGFVTRTVRAGYVVEVSGWPAVVPPDALEAAQGGEVEL